MERDRLLAAIAAEPDALENWVVYARCTDVGTARRASLVLATRAAIHASRRRSKPSQQSPAVSGIAHGKAVGSPTGFVVGESEDA